MLVRSRCVRLEIRDGATLYSEFAGSIACRQFLIEAGRTRVAPQTLAFVDGPGVDALAAGGSSKPISLASFQEMWDLHAQPQLHLLAERAEDFDRDASIWYVLTPFPAQFKDQGEAGSVIYTEFAGGIGRRDFEVWPDRVAVGPYETQAAYELDPVKIAVELGIDETGSIIPATMRPRRIRHADFETNWERFAIPHLRELASRSF